VVLHGEELLNPQRFSGDLSLSTAGILESFFSGNRPFLNRGD
jgi:hypothetical protein